MRIDDLLMARLGGGAVQGLGDPATRVMLYTANSLQPNQVPTADPFIALWRRDWIRKETADLYAGVNGYWLAQLPWYPLRVNFDRGLFSILTNPAPKNISPADIASALDTYLPSIDDILAMRRRGLIDDSGLGVLTRSHSLHSPNMVRLMQFMSMQIPPPSDLIRMAVREVFNPQQRAALGLDEEYDQQTDYKDWAQAQGIGLSYMRTDQGMLISRDFARDYWAAHWQLPSPGQGYEMLYRLRPTRIAKWQQNIPEVKPFEMSDLRTLLKAEDYSPAWRDRLAAISFRLPGRIDLRRMFLAAQITKAELIESYLDLGFGTVDSARLADFADWQRTNRLTRFDLGRLVRRGAISEQQYTQRMAQQGYTDADAQLMLDGNRPKPMLSVVLRWYRKNTILREVAVSRIKELGYSEADAERYVLEIDTDRQRRRNAPAVAKVQEGMRIGAISIDRARELLRRLGMSQDEIDAQEADWNAQTRIDSVRAALRRIRRQYLSGYIDNPTARAQLEGMDIVGAMREIYIGRWEAELGPDRRQLSAQQVVNALANGLINPIEARRRLSILGYDNQTANILLLAGEQSRQRSAARAAIAASRTVKEQQRAAKAALKEADAAKRRAISDLARHGSPPVLQTWVARSVIPLERAQERLREMYWSEEDIRAWSLVALQRREEKAASINKANQAALKSGKATNGTPAPPT